MIAKKIETALANYLRSRKIVLGGDGLGGQHFVIIRSAPRTIPHLGTGGVDTECAWTVQTGEKCGFEHERIDLTDMAKAIAGDL